LDVQFHREERLAGGTVVASHFWRMRQLSLFSRAKSVTQIDTGMQREVIEGKMIFVVESHHEVLEAWVHVRHDLEHAPNLITLDFHTDTHEPFDYYLYETGVSDSHREAERLRLLSTVDYRQVESLHQAIRRLKHDEHILTAIRLDIIAAAFLVCQNTPTFTSVFELRSLHWTY
jgi:hypothetical protein